VVGDGGGDVRRELEGDVADVGLFGTFREGDGRLRVALEHHVLSHVSGGGADQRHVRVDAQVLAAVRARVQKDQRLLLLGRLQSVLDRVEVCLAPDAILK
jgi:hypothetical protein